jgi:glucokinase
LAQPQNQKIDRIVCDLGRTRVRLALNPSEQLLDDNVVEWTTESFNRSEKPIAELFEKFMRANDLKPRNTTVLMSVHTHVLYDKIEFYDKLPSWQFSIEALKAELGVKAFQVINDMVALGYATPLYRVTGKYQLIGNGVAKRGAPILTVGIRSGVGALCMVLAPKLDGGDSVWLPVPSEGGHIELAPRDSFEADLLTEIAGNLNRPPTVSDVLSSDGTMRLYRLLAERNGATPDYELRPIGLNRRAQSNLQDSSTAAATIQLWCRFLGSYTKNLALAFGAHGGIYIAGPVPTDLLGGSQYEHHNIFRERFESGGPGRTYLSSIPTALITHKNPYLLGLGRIHL